MKLLKQKQMKIQIKNKTNNNNKYKKVIKNPNKLIYKSVFPKSQIQNNKNTIYPKSNNPLNKKLKKLK